MRSIAILLLLVLTAACAAGCSAPPPEESPAPTTAATPAPAGGEEPDIVVTVASLTPRYSPDRPFVFTARIEAENQGAIEGRGVVITVTLIDEEANRITDTKNQ
jgi:ABC-type glycerol-3-phosphate transport system substrate-binding protein